MPLDLSKEGSSRLRPTPGQILGPFYPPVRNPEADNDITRFPDQNAAAGPKIEVSGQVLDTQGRPAQGVLVEIWQCDSKGIYRHPDAPETENVDPNFEGYGRFVTGADGRYSFRALKPVSYPRRTPHLHFKLQADGFETLVTQMYVDGEPENDDDFALLRVEDEEQRQRLISTLVPTQAGDVDFTAAFTIVLAESAK